MPVNRINVGVDYYFGYFDGNTSNLVDLGDIQDVKITARKHEIKSMPYNAVPRFGFVPDGYDITFNITRTSAVLETLMVTFSQNFNAGAVIQPGYLNESINNPDGSTSRFQYINFVFYLTDHGDISREKQVTLRGEGLASDKVIIA